ncbi:MAG: hypothetical protein GY708_07445 [Actinomycetia bacterium]|nr:hypothetical protein [Actinomycetes bacterium]MCP4960530.1 hypothetical protein [Actinomycetes bacterium]
MIDLLLNTAPWSILLASALVFGFFPGVGLRAITRLYAHDDPRRIEIQAELYAVPFSKRWLWVAQQLEVALFDGLGPRLTPALDSVLVRFLRITFPSRPILESLTSGLGGLSLIEKLAYVGTTTIAGRREPVMLLSGIELNAAHPDTFWIPSADEKAKAGRGDYVKLMFESSDGWTERMWVSVRSTSGRCWKGTLENDPIGLPKYGFGAKLKFNPDNVIDILPADVDWQDELDYQRSVSPACGPDSDQLF